MTSIRHQFGRVEHWTKTVQVDLVIHIPTENVYLSTELVRLLELDTVPTGCYPYDAVAAALTRLGMTKDDDDTPRPA